MDVKVNFSGRAHHYLEEEKQAVIQAMEDAEPLTQGRYLKEFEKKFSEYIGMPHCFAMSNATAALEVAAQLCQFKEGDEVIIPSHTFTSSAYPFVKKGARIVWADVDLAARVITPDTLKKKISKRTKAIVVVHLYGYAADMPEIMKIAKEHNLLVIEDAAQSLGAEVNGVKSGSFGDFGVFSFHSHKNITTLGEGGILAVRDEKVAKVVPMLRHNGHCDFPFARQDYWIPAMGNVDLPELNGMPLWPNNYCIGEVECALGLKLLKRIDSINEEKRNRALWFIDELTGYPELQFHRVDNKRHNYHLLAARFTNGKRDEFIRKMFYEKGIKCVVQYYPLNRYPLYQKAGFGDADCPNADLFFDTMVSFPFHHWINESDMRYILNSTKEILKAIGV
jgi:dTDP-4-amino-4,6-dideoxygalactose transaminase